MLLKMSQSRNAVQTLPRSLRFMYTQDATHEEIMVLQFVQHRRVIGNIR